MHDLDSGVKAEFRDNLRRYFERKFTSSRAPAPDHAAPSFDRQAWKDFASDMALQGLSIEEGFGGSGFGHGLSAILFEELGRLLVPAPFITSALAAEVLRASADQAAMHRYLPEIAAGDLIATVALPEREAPAGSDIFQCKARQTSAGHSVSGAKRLVLDAQLSDMIIVTAHGEGLALFAIDTDQEGVRIDTHRGIDDTRRVSTVSFEEATGIKIGTSDCYHSALSHAVAIAQVHLASEMIGASQFLLEETTNYARSRIQFGKAIGSFQVIQHDCAEMYVDLQFAKSAQWAALNAIGSNAKEAAIYANVAKLACSDTFVKIAERSLQIHGGIGFTWEHFLHLYLKRAKGNQFLLGTPAELRQAIGGHLSLPN